MRMSKTVISWSVCLVLAISCLLPAQEKSLRDNHKSCREFVQGFYDWYVPKTRKLNAGRSWDLALKYRRAAFSPELVRRLREDSEAQAKVAREIVGLDFDPFLNSQDPDERYVVGNIAAKGDTYWIDVHSLRSGQKSEKPVVVAEVVPEGERCLFVNFHYGKSEQPERENLLGVLKSMRQNREKHPR